MLQCNFIKEKLYKCEPVLGSWAVLPSPHSIEILCLAGLDFIVIDREHGISSLETAASMVISAENRGVSPLIRIPELTLGEVQRALDLGAHGIHIPNVSNLEQLEILVDLTKYPPLGNRGFSPFTRAAKYSAKYAKEQVREANDSTLIAIHIEGKKALENLDLFLSSPVIDILFIGLYDLSKSLGKPGAVDDPEILGYLEDSVKRIRKAGKVAGTIVISRDQMQAAMEYGVNYITYSADCDLLYHSYAMIADHFENIRAMANLK